MRGKIVSEQLPPACRGSGDGMQAKGTEGNTGSPDGDCGWINWRLARDRPGRLGWRRGL